jgi:outer membrane lipoprotein SlyB
MQAQAQQPTQVQTQQTPQAPVQPAAPPTQAQYAAQEGQPSYAQQPYAEPQQRHPPACASCGTVESVATVRHEGHGTGIGAVGGAVAGGLLGNQFGRGTGRTAMTVLGAVGGGFAGNSVEKHLRSDTSYQVRVHMQNGHTRYFTYHQPPPFQQGERVRIEGGTLVAN